MSERPEEIRLHDGTLIRHKVAGYEGRIDGTTEIKACFTAAGALLEKPSTKQTFQYRVAIAGESMRRIAPAEDLEILDGVVQVVCPRCHTSFWSKPGLTDKPGGRCQCGAWICPSCLACRSTGTEPAKEGQSSCLKERKRLLRKLAAQKKRRGG
ncbi:MAG: hypothetical protein ACE5HC_10590 [Candidatus Binatia bacterium]